MSTERAIQLVIANWHIAGCKQLIRLWEEVQAALAG